MLGDRQYCDPRERMHLTLQRPPISRKWRRLSGKISFGETRTLLRRLPPEFDLEYPE
jgi:hypothetical protein